MDLAFQYIDTYREISIVTGVLYIFGLVAGVLSVAHAVDDSDYLTKSALHAKQVYKAACFQFLMAIFYIGVAIVLYPVLKTYNEILATGFLGFRIVAVIFLLTGVIILLLILKLSQEYVKVGSSDLSSFKRAGDLLKTGRDLINHVCMVITLCIGGIMLYIIMLQTGLIPAWLSVWGLFGSSMAILASILVMVKNMEILKPAYIMLNIPIALQEMVFAVWLIVKGFKQV